jgi:hypothetical protein
MTAVWAVAMREKSASYASSTFVVAGHFVDQDVVHKTAVFVEQAGIMRLAGFELAGMVGGDEIGELASFRAPDFDFAHMADIEETHGGAHGLVLVDDSGILHRHIPAAKIHHPGV